MKKRLLLVVVQDEENSVATLRSLATYVSKMSLNDLRFLMFRCIFLRLVELLDQCHRLASKSTVELSSGTGGQKWKKFHGLHSKKRIEIDAAEGKLAKGTALAGHCLVSHGDGLWKRRRGREL